MNETEEELDAFEYFAGCVPPGGYFHMKLDELREWIEPIEDIDRVSRMPFEVCYIGAVAYFEAFFKDHFAAILNICPFLIKNLKAHGKNVFLDAVDLLDIDPPLTAKMGFILSEKYNFGPPKEINSNFLSILNISPFGTSHKSKYDEVLKNRNLLVHHGGIITNEYSRDLRENPDVAYRVFLDSFVVSKSILIETLNFMDEIAEKTCSSSVTKLKETIIKNNRFLTSEQIKAIDYLGINLHR